MDIPRCVIARPDPYRSYSKGLLGLPVDEKEATRLLNLAAELSSLLNDE